MDSYTLNIFGMLLLTIGVMGSILTPIAIKDMYTQVFVLMLGVFLTILGSLGMIVAHLIEKRYQRLMEKIYEEDRQMKAKGWDERRRAVERYLSKRWG